MSDTANPFNDYAFIDARLADRGSFTIALDKALSKLEKFQLPDPSFFILQWIQALIASGCKTIKITIDKSQANMYSLVIEFDGPGYSQKELQQIYDHVFLSGRDRSVDRLRELSLGWLSASALKPGTLSIISNGWRLRRATDPSSQKKLEVQPAQPNTTPVASATHKLTIAGAGAYEFERIISSNCGDIPADLYINGKLSSGGDQASSVPWPNRDFTNLSTQGVMGATYGTNSSSYLTFMRYGVSIIRRPEPELKPAVAFKVSDPTLSKNVSQTDLVRDEAYQEFLARLRSEMKSMGVELIGRRIPSYQRDSLNKYLQAYIYNIFDIRALEDPKRLALLGPDMEKLIKQPVFAASRATYCSLEELYQFYKQNNFLLYSLDPNSRTLEWRGLLLAPELEEVIVLRKFFPNLVALSYDQVLQQIRAGGKQIQSTHLDGPKLTQLTISTTSKEYTLLIPDSYPTGQAILRAEYSRFCTPIAGLGLTMLIEFSGLPPSNNETIGLIDAIRKNTDKLKQLLSQVITNNETTTSFTRQRAAELLCEVINYEIESQTRSESEILDGVQDTPLIGLENGSLVSLNDLKTYLQHIPTLYIGTAFIEGLESGSLDPMPRAAALVKYLYASRTLIPIEQVRNQIKNDSELSLAIRRQTLIPNLATQAAPKQYLERFATEAAEEAAELGRIEREYRDTIEGKEIFIKPNEARLAELATKMDNMDASSDMDNAYTGENKSSEQGKREGGSASLDKPADKAQLPKLQDDLSLCLAKDPDLIPERNSIHVEQKEPDFQFYLTTCQPKQGKIFLLYQNELTIAPTKQAVRGFIRLLDSPSPDKFDKIYTEGLEKLTIKAIDSLQRGPASSSLLKTLQQWLLDLSCHNPKRLLSAKDRGNDLYDINIVPCLGQRLLSWRVLHDQAERYQKIFITNNAIAKAANVQYEVIILKGMLTSELLEEIWALPVETATASQSDNTFESLYQNARKELATILLGQTTPLLSDEIIAELAAETSRWKKWRSGFMSWDQENSVLVLNPSHKLGQELAKKYQEDPAWSQIFASALFSTINRGLLEVEDRHEREFLEQLIETLS